MKTIGMTGVVVAFMMIFLGCTVGSGAEQPAPQSPPLPMPGEEQMVASVWSFDALEVGSLPEGFRIEGTNPRGPLASWSVEADASAPSSPNVLALTDTKEGGGSSFNLCWTDNATFKDGVIEVKVKAGSGREDQGGGPIWRVQDRDNYYIARWNPLEDNFRVYIVKAGRRKMLEGGRVKGDPATWHTIRIEQMGDEIRCSFDGKALDLVRDSSFPDAGGVGLWTKADAATSFDDFEVKALPLPVDAP